LFLNGFYRFCMYIFGIMQNDTSMLKIVFSTRGHRALDKNWKGRYSGESFARLYYIVAGEGEIRHHGEKIILTPGRFYLIPTRANMSHSCEKSCEIVWIHFNISLYGHIDIFDIHSFSFAHIPEDHEQAFTDMVELLSLLDRQDIYSQLRSKAILFDIISSFFKFQPSSKSYQNQEQLNRLTPVLNYHF